MSHRLPPHLDHVIVTTPDLADAVAQVERATGVAPAPGGVHPTFGTRNYLVQFQDGTYLELLGADPENTEFSGTRPFGVDDATTTAARTWAIAPSPAAAAFAAGRAAGVDVGDLGDGSRRTADGTLLTWQLTPPLHGDPSGVIPFVIDWGATGSPARTIAPTLTLESFEVTHPEPERVRDLLRALGTDVEVAAGPAGVRLTVSGPGGSLTL
jgi:hypothetical protein